METIDNTKKISANNALVEKIKTIIGEVPSDRPCASGNKARLEAVVTTLENDNKALEREQQNSVLQKERKEKQEKEAAERLEAQNQRKAAQGKNENLKAGSNASAAMKVDPKDANATGK